MWSVVRRNPLAVLFALLLHLILAAALLMNDWSREPRPYGVTADVVQARVVDAGKLEQEANRLKVAEARQQAQREEELRSEQQRLDLLKQEQAQEEQRLAALEQRRKAEEQAQAERRAEERQQREAEARRVSELEKQRQEEAKLRVEAEKKRQAAEAERQAEEKRKQAAEAKRRAEEEKKRQAAEAKRRAEEEQKRQAAERQRKEEQGRKATEVEERRKQEAARKAEAERKASEARAKAAREAQLKAALEAERRGPEVDRYRAVIQQSIERSWIQPPDSRHLRCTLEVRLIPGGDVVAVRVIQSSGNAGFDRSVENAVYRAAPLPVPEGTLFESFRTLIFVFDPNK